MNTRHFMKILVAISLVAMAFWLTSCRKQEECQCVQMPYADLTVADVSEVKIEYGAYEYILTEGEKGRFVDMLNLIVIYQEVPGARKYFGIFYDVFLVTMVDGSTVVIQNAFPEFMIDGVGYFCDDWACNQLLDFYDELLESKLKPQFDSSGSSD